MSIDQIGIALTGVTAIFLTQSKSKQLQRYACLFGMAGQPFWIWSAIAAEQWGILLLTAFYTAAWAKGIWTHWLFKPTPTPHPFASSAYAMREGHRLVVCFENREDAFRAHEYVASISAAQSEGGA